MAKVTDYKVVTVKIEYEMLAKIDMYAIKHKLYRSEVIRLALEKFLKEECKECDEPVQIKVEKFRI